MPAAKKPVVKKKTATKKTVKKVAKKTTPKKTAAKKATIHLLLVIDKSGSMMPKVNDVIGGFNTYIDGLKKDKKNDYRVSLISFDSTVSDIYIGKKLSEVEPLNHENYIPSGMTALNDGVGHAITTCAAKAKDPVLLVVFTDGEENSSREFTTDKIRELVEDKQKGTWTFVFMGSDISTWSSARSYGISVANTLQVDPANMQLSVKSLIGSTSNYCSTVSRGITQSNTSFFSGNGSGSDGSGTK